MASKVNTRFVVILAAVLVALVGGVAALALVVSSRSGASYIAKGDAKMAAGDYDAAASFYSIAVNKEQQNVPWLLKWREALSKKVPPNDVVFGEDFKMYLTVHRALATARKTDVQAHRDFLDMLLKMTLAVGGSRESWTNLRTEADAALRFFDGSETPESQGLRRYRGLAAMGLDAARMEISESDVEAGKEDLVAALAADPGDAASAVALCEYYRRRSAEALAKRNTALQQQLLTKGRDVLSAALAVKPGDPDLVLTGLACDLQDSVSGIDPALPATEIQSRQIAAVKALVPRLDEATAALRTTDTSRIGIDQISQFLGLADAIDPATAADRAQELVDRALADRPHSAELIYFKGRLLALRGEVDAAIAQFQKTIDLPPPHVGFEGIKQYWLVGQSLFWQANTALLTVDKTPDGPERDRAIADAAKFRDRLEQRVPKTDPGLKFIDAKLAIARHDLALAQKDLNEYSGLSGDTGPLAFEALVLGAQVSERLGAPGRAAELYQRALTARPQYVPVMMALANITHGLKDLKTASDLYRRVLQLDPSNTVAAQQLEIIRALQSDQAPTIADPVLNALVTAQRLQYPPGGKVGDPDAAIAVLRKAITANNSDPRLVGALATVLVNRNDIPGAVAAVDAGLQAHPDSDVLRSLRRNLSGDTLEGALALADEAGRTPIDKAMNRYAVYRARKLPDEAKKTLAEAAAMEGSHDDARVLESLFLAALQAGNLTEADRLSEEAATKNIDLADGLTFKARLQIAREKFADAGVTLQQALDKRGPNAAVYRLLGDVQMRQGRPLQAIEQYRNAQRMSPTDPEIVRALLMALAGTQQNVEALRVARDAEPFMGPDVVFANMRYLLEALVGSRENAVKGREQLAVRAPDDEDNTLSLVQLYIEDRQWSKARALLDDRRGKKDTINLVGLDARWHADQGDLEGGKAVWTKYLASIDPKATGPSPFIGYSQFLVQRGDPAGALEQLTSAAQYQDPKSPIADLARADTLFGMRRYGEAAQVYDSIIAAGAPDPELVVHARMIEAYVQQGDLKTAGQRLAAVGQAADSNLTLLVLRATLAQRQGDRPAARQALDHAVERFPDDPMPYFRRALFLVQDPDSESDALADLDTALRLRPSYWQALQTRAMINKSRGRKNEALTDLRTAVETNLFQDDVRLNYMIELLEANREPDAIEVGRAALRIRPNDTALASGLADLFAQRGRWDAAAVFYGHIWELTHDQRDAVPYLAALLHSNPPALPQAAAILATPGLPIDSSTPLLMARADLRMKQKDNDGAYRDIMAAYEKSKAQPRSLSAWYQTLCAVVTDPAVRLQIFERISPDPATAQWLQSMRCDTLALLPARRDEATSMAESLLAGSADTNLKLSLARMLQDIYNADQKYDKALAACKAGLAVAPTDAMLNNNAASYLTNRLNRPQEALPYAEAAAKAVPNNHAILDTLAEVLAATGQHDKAIDAYEQAAQVAPTTPLTAGYLLKGLKLAVESPDHARARKLAQNLRFLMRQGTDILTPEQNKDLDEYERQAGR
ncbi:MAG: tetratricopeptide repeat protein [Phycisphaerales bacterium]|nr:tetratricopeptide repeat protein [Phycisphaerales bacterium]